MEYYPAFSMSKSTNEMRDLINETVFTFGWRGLNVFGELGSGEWLVNIEKNEETPPHKMKIV